MDSAVRYKKFNWDIALKKPNNFKDLAIRGKEFNKLDPKIYKLQEIEKIFIWEMGEVYDVDFTKFKKLKSLDISDCNYVDLNLFFLKIDSLKIKDLVLIGLRFNQFPYFILKFKNLESLELSNCRFDEIPEEFKNFKKLKKLNLTNNLFSSINPNAFDSLVNLEELEFRGTPFFYNKDFEEFYQVIKNCTNLSSIDFSNVCLNRFPYELGKLKNLKKLYILDYKITELIDFNCGFESLEHLDIMGTEIEKVPSSYNKIKSIYTKKHLGPELPPHKLNE